MTNWKDVLEAALQSSKYEEDVYVNNHTTVWGSWWGDHQWGYKCCHQTYGNSFCTGATGIEASEESADLMRANMAFDAVGTDDLVLYETNLGESLKKDERKSKYNVKWNDEVTDEDVEAYRMIKIHFDDPMKDFLH